MSGSILDTLDRATSQQGRPSSSPTCCSPRSTTCARGAASRSRCACSSRRSRSSASRQRTIDGRGHRLLHRASRCTIDVDLVQALHGRAPSVATGVKRMQPDCVVFTLQGDGDMVNEGLQEVLHTAARGEAVTCILLNNGVFGETGGHMTATSVLGQRTKNSLDGRDAEYHGYPILIGDLIARLEGAAYVAAGSVHNAGVGRADEEDVHSGRSRPSCAARGSRSSRCSRCARPAGSSRPARARTT